MTEAVPSFGIVVPTLNAGPSWPGFLEALRGQSVAPDTIVVLDSGSTDGTPTLAHEAGCLVISIPPAEFNHGGTRQRGADMLADKDLIVYLTQDAMPTGKDAVAGLIRPFQDADVGAAYGRQLPRPQANPVEAHARLFNYPERSVVRSLRDRETIGIRAFFLSNSFAAYRRTALMQVGGFPSNTIMAEDALVAAQMLKAGWKTAYVAESAVLHSHPYTLREEFRRYFDIGVFHNREHWLLEEFGNAGREGGRFVVSEMRYLIRQSPHLIPSSLLRMAAKLTGYRLGRNEQKLSPKMIRRLSMHKRFWDAQTA